MRIERKLWLDYYVGGALHVALKPVVRLLGRVLRRDHDLAHSRDVCFLKLLGGGSLVIAYPLLLALKRSGRVDRLRLVTTPAAAAFAHLLGVFDEVIVIDDRSAGRLISSSLQAFRRLFRVPAIVDLEIHSRLSVVLSLLLCARNRVGCYSTASFWRQGLSTHLLYFNNAEAVYHFYDHVAELFGVEVPDYAACAGAFGEVAAQGLRRAGRSRAGVVAVAPCCSDFGKVRMLAPGQWGRILAAEGAVAAGATVLLVGAPADRAYCEELSAVLRTTLDGRGITVRNTCGDGTLPDAVRAVAGADHLYCIDSSLLHVARLLDVPTDSYWGPTDPRLRLRPWPVSHERAHYHRISCSPCVHVTYPPPCGGKAVCLHCFGRDQPAAEPDTLWLA